MTADIATIEIARPPQAVFAFATDPLRFTQWQHDVVSVRRLGDSRFTTTRRIAGSERTMTQRIIRDEAPRHWAAEGIDGPVRAHATITIEPIHDGTASRVTFTLDFEGHGVGVPLIPLIRRLAHKAAPVSHANLKKLLESS